ncbi:MAG: zinc-dependent alcohol dehydrogenase family protein [Vulcanimicrobiaceae bacterium]
MIAAVCDRERGGLRIREVPIPRPRSGEVLLRVRACGVCRTDLHVIDGELPLRRAQIIPGHQIVADVADANGAPALPAGVRVGVSWLGGVDGTCSQCVAGRENLCDAPEFTGYDRDGGFAEFVTARADFVLPLPEEMPDLQAAPLLCAGIIGYRSLRVAGVQPGERVGLYGFGASAHLVLQVLQAWGCEVYVATRGSSHGALALQMGATWAGGISDVPPVPLDRAITFAPSGEVVVAALASLRKGGVVAVNAIHIDRIPQFDYDSLLWGERQIRSVSNMTRTDAREFLALAASIGIRPKTTAFPLDRTADAVAAVRGDRIDGAAVVVPANDAKRR